MSVNGVTGNVNSSYDSYQTSTKNSSQKSSETAASTTENTSGVVYEPSADAKTAGTKTTKYKPDVETIAKLKAETNNQKAQLMELVHKMLNGQSNSYGKANDIWSTLSSGNFTVDAATKSQAQADIAEDGYWGVSKTSQRILDFATALTGGDPDKIEEMRSAFEKGFKMAEKTWGGKLPDISQNTYDAVMKGFDKLKEDAGIA